MADRGEAGGLWNVKEIRGLQAVRTELEGKRGCATPGFEV